MIPPLNKIIQKYLKHKLHAEENGHIQQGMIRFRQKFPHASADQITDIESRLHRETTRLFPLADKSILTANLLRSMIIFWMIALLGTLITLLQGNWPTVHLLTFFLPLISAFFTWSASCATIPVLYNKRIEGGMNSTLATFALEQGLRQVQTHHPQPASSYRITLSSLPARDRDSDPQQDAQLEEDLEALLQHAPPSQHHNEESLSALNP